MTAQTDCRTEVVARAAIAPGVRLIAVAVATLVTALAAAPILAIAAQVMA